MLLTHSALGFYKQRSQSSLSELVSVFLAVHDEMAEEVGQSSQKVAQFSGGVSLTWQGT